jgi:hypothetical protein
MRNMWADQTILGIDGQMTIEAVENELTLQRTPVYGGRFKKSLPVEALLSATGVRTANYTVPILLHYLAALPHPQTHNLRIPLPIESIEADDEYECPYASACCSVESNWKDDVRSSRTYGYFDPYSQRDLRKGHRARV